MPAVSIGGRAAGLTLAALALVGVTDVAALAWETTSEPPAAAGEQSREEAIKGQEADQQRDDGMPTDGAHELDGLLREEHPDAYGGLWRHGRRVVVAVVGDATEVQAGIEATFDEPGLVDTVEATYTQRQLEQTRGVLEAGFDELVATQTVHALGVDVRANRVFVEAVDADQVDLAGYLDDDQAAMVDVAAAPPAQTLADDGEGSSGVASWTSVAVAAAATLAGLGVAGGLTQRRRLRRAGSP